jgi:hypothetical protein
MIDKTSVDCNCKVRPHILSLIYYYLTEHLISLIWDADHVVQVNQAVVRVMEVAVREAVIV